MFNILNIKIVIRLLGITVLGLSLGLLLRPNHVMAAATTDNVIEKGINSITGDGCGENAPYVNAIVYVAFRNVTTGKFLGFAEEFNMRVDTLNSPDGHYGHNGNYGMGGIQLVKYDGVNAQAKQSRNFNTYGGPADDFATNANRCFKKRANKVPGIPDTNDNTQAQSVVFKDTMDPNDPKIWMLNCGFQDGHSRGFQFKGTGVPSITGSTDHTNPHTMPAGYKALDWGDPGIVYGANSVAYEGDANKRQFTIVLDFDVTPISWDASPYVSIKGDTTNTIRQLNDGTKYVTPGTTIEVDAGVHGSGSNTDVTPVLTSTLSGPYINSTIPVGGFGANSWNTVQQHWRTVPYGTPDRTQLCYSHTISPSSQHSGVLGGAITSPVECVWVYTESSPIVTSNNSDVHAGSNCGVGSYTGLNGIVVNPGSSADYVVTTAGSSINGMRAGSNNAATATAYTTVCRPDLVAGAHSLTADQIHGAGSYDISGWSGIHQLNGAASIHGTVNNKLTILAFSGAVTIDGNITIGGSGSTTRSAPSLGIISAEDVVINPAVKRVDAYVFSDKTIYTCNAGKAACGNTLNVNGFLMAHQLKLNRTGLAPAPDGSGNTTSPVGERVVMSGQIYLNPPSGFGLPDSYNFLKSIGERPPAY